MKVTIVPIVIGAFGTITKGLLKGLEDLEVGGREETIQMTALLIKARIIIIIIIRNNYFKTKIDKTQQNNECRLCGDGDETINHVIRE